MRHFVFILMAVGVITAPFAAFGRDTEVILSVSGAVESGAEQYLGGMLTLFYIVRHSAVFEVTQGARPVQPGIYRSVLKLTICISDNHPP